LATIIRILISGITSAYPQLFAGHRVEREMEKERQVFDDFENKPSFRIHVLNKNANASMRHVLVPQRSTRTAEKGT
jgi:hypothetical protein